jgi:hypothetical protein
MSYERARARRTALIVLASVVGLVLLGALHATGVLPPG